MDISFLLGKTITAIELNGIGEIFITCGHEKFKMYHEQDCCENVYVHSIVGDLISLFGKPIIRAEEICNSDVPNDDGTATWTTYHLNDVSIKWLGTSNGYYSESVYFGPWKD